MNTRIKQFLRNVKNLVITGVNRFRGKEYIFHPKNFLHIETASICNLDCNICGYGKKDSPKVEMSNELFFSCVDQAVEMGYDSFSLTPTTGDVFAGKDFLEKLHYLENSPKVKTYFFVTNFTLPKEDQILELLKLKKLKDLFISVYGHDLESFIAIAKSTEKVHSRLVSNLNFLLDHSSKKQFNLHLEIRSYQSFDLAGPFEGDLIDVLRRFKVNGDTVDSLPDYNNWAGMVTNEDVKGLEMYIKEDSVVKNGACGLIFADLIVAADGRINACACRDANRVLSIGDLNEKSLNEIISNKNSTYMELIETQQKNQFPDVCKSCDFYRSIYRDDSHNRYSTGRPSLSLNEFYEEISH